MKKSAIVVMLVVAGFMMSCNKKSDKVFQDKDTVQVVKPDTIEVVRDTTVTVDTLK